MNNQMVMKKPLEIWQGILATCSLLLVIGTIIVQQSNKIASQGERIVFLQERNLDTQSQLHDINASLKEVSNKLTEIQIAIVNKQDRQK